MAGEVLFLIVLVAALLVCVIGYAVANRRADEHRRASARQTERDLRQRGA